jgi:hypothetical protein
MQLDNIVRVLCDVDQIVINRRYRRCNCTVAEWELIVKPADQIGLVDGHSCVDWRSVQKPLP